MYYFYVLESDMGKLYTGSTNNLKRRLREHQEKKSRATKGYNWTLIYYEAYRAESDARKREQMVKKNTGTLTALRKRIGSSRLFES